MGYSVARDVIAGCFQCWGSEGHWIGPNAQGVAARHHYATGHETWADVNMSIRYGGGKVSKKEEKPSEPEKGKSAS
jgi:hypothetical protein